METSSMRAVAEEIVRERIRQTVHEGFSEAWDDQYQHFELARAAAGGGAVAHAVGNDGISCAMHTCPSCDGRGRLED